MTLKEQIQNDMKDAMRAHDAERLSIIRFLLAAIKQREIDERITLDDAQVLAVIEKQVKQHRDSIEQYQQAGRDELVAKETKELNVLQSYLPEPLSEAEIGAIINDAIAEASATSIKEMGKVMSIIKPKIQGRAEISVVSAKVKTLLS